MDLSRIKSAGVASSTSFIFKNTRDLHIRIIPKKQAGEDYDENLKREWLCSTQFTKMK